MLWLSRHANLHADSLMVLQAMHEAVRVKPSSEAGSSGGAGSDGSTKHRASRRATLRRAASTSTLMMELVAAAYTSLASAWTVYDPRKEFARMGVPNAQVRRVRLCLLLFVVLCVAWHAPCARVRSHVVVVSKLTLVTSAYCVLVTSGGSLARTTTTACAPPTPPCSVFPLPSTTSTSHTPHPSAARAGCPHCHGATRSMGPPSHGRHSRWCVLRAYPCHSTHSSLVLGVRGWLLAGAAAGGSW